MVVEKKAVAEETQQFEPIIPDSTDFDWIRLPSGEWLKGEIIVLRRGSLEFESDELGDLTFDWDDIGVLRSPRENSVLFEGKITATGTLLIRDGVVVVGGEETKQYDRKLLLSIIPGEPTERNYWSGKFSLGIDNRAGNTNQVDFTSYFLTLSPHNRLKLVLGDDVYVTWGQEQGISFEKCTKRLLKDVYIPIWYSLCT